MLSVVHDFNKLKKYNIESILGINNAGIPENAPVSEPKSDDVPQSVQEDAKSIPAETHVDEAEVKESA